MKRMIKLAALSLTIFNSSVLPITFYNMRNTKIGNVKLTKPLEYTLEIDLINDVVPNYFTFTERRGIVETRDYLILEVEKIHFTNRGNKYGVKLTTSDNVTIEYSGYIKDKSSFIEIDDMVNLFTLKWFVKHNKNSMTAETKISFIYYNDAGTSNLIIKWNVNLNRFEQVYPERKEIVKFGIVVNGESIALELNDDKFHFKLYEPENPTEKLTEKSKLLKLNELIYSYWGFDSLKGNTFIKPDSLKSYAISEFEKVDYEQMKNTLLGAEKSNNSRDHIIQIKKSVVDNTKSFIEVKKVGNVQVRFELVGVVEFYIGKLDDTNPQSSYSIQLNSQSGAVTYTKSQSNSKPMKEAMQFKDLVKLFEDSWGIQDINEIFYIFKRVNFRGATLNGTSLHYFIIELDDITKTFNFSYEGANWQHMSRIEGVESNVVNSYNLTVNRSLVFTVNNEDGQVGDLKKLISVHLVKKEISDWVMVEKPIAPKSKKRKSYNTKRKSKENGAIKKKQKRINKTVKKF
jgi:hypothetical protein